MIKLVAGFLEKDGKVLLLKRSMEKSLFPGCFERPGGHVDDEETDAVALKREFLEEAGLEVEVGDYYFSYEAEAKGNMYAEQSYRVSAIGSTRVRLSPEHTEHRWVSEDELADLEMSENEREAVKAGFVIGG